MIFIETKLPGAFVVELTRFEDERGFFALAWSEDELARTGLISHFVESNISFNHRKGTLRGMHYQSAPHGQIKLVRCTSGAIYDVIIDLRPESETFKQWIAVELSAENRRMLYVPLDFAHGFQTLADNSEVCYHMSSSYRSQSSTGVRWDDPAFGIEWPPAERIVIDRDREYPDFAG